MKKLKIIFNRLLKENQGQSLVLVALSLVVLLGFGALVTDAGYLYVQRRESQNIADAAALAGTWVIQDGEDAVNELAKDYAELHGYERDDITATIVDDGKSVTATVNKDHDLFFAKVLNINSAYVGATATATRSVTHYSSHKDILPVGLVSWRTLFYSAVKKNQGNSPFLDREGLLKPEIRDYLLSLEKANNEIPHEKKIINYSQNNPSIKNPTKDDPGADYPRKSTEEKFHNDLQVYKGALQVLMALQGDTDDKFIVKLEPGNIESGMFGWINLTGSKSASSGAKDIIKWIEEGYKDDLGTIIEESGNVNSATQAIEKYIAERGPEAFILAPLPSTINISNGKIKANVGEYLIVHVSNLKVNGHLVTGKIVELYETIPVILPGEEEVELLPNSWLIK